jgi:hypothetical protein
MLPPREENVDYLVNLFFLLLILIALCFIHLVDRTKKLWKRIMNKIKS